MNQPAQRRPPRLARWILQALCPDEFEAEVVEDADEEFERRLREGGFARIWYWRQALHPDVWRLRREVKAEVAVWPGRRSSMSDWVRVELRQAFRVFRRSPGFVATVVATLAVGIGGTTAIFALVNGLLLRPVPGVMDPHQLAAVQASQGGGAFGVSSFADYEDFAERTRSLSSVAAFKYRTVDADAGAATEPIGGLLVTSSYFDVVGVRPLLGRFFGAEVDVGPSAHAEVVLTAGLWRRWFAEDPDVVGTTIVLNGRRYTIIGVAPTGFAGTQRVDVPDLFVPMTMQPDLMPSSGYLLDRRGWGGIQQVGRIADGFNLEAVNAEIESLGAGLAVEYPNTNGDRAYRAVSFREGAMPGQTKGLAVQMSLLLGAVVVALWMVVCLNVSNLLLARSMRRRGELAIRAALGAGRARIGATVLLESLAIAVVAGAVGMAVARGLSAAIEQLPLPILFDARLSLSTVAFAGALAVASAMLCALVPSVVMSATDPKETSGHQRQAQSGTRKWFSRALVVAQVSVSVVLLFGTGLFAQSFMNLTSADPGFDASRIATAEFNPSLQGYEPAQMEDYYRRLYAAVSAMPGVESVAVADGLPSAANFGSDSWFLQNDRDPDQSVSLSLSVVSPNYFGALGVPVVAGRGFSSNDSPDQPPVTIVNEATARLVERRTGSDAVGQRMSAQGPDGPFLEIVGVVGDSRTGRAESAAPFVYGSYEQVLPLGIGGGRMVVMARTEGPPEPLLAELRRVGQAVDPSVAASNVVTMERFLADLLVADRLIVTALGISSLLAALLVAIGVYGLLAYLVGQRSREFGIRLALGAHRGTLSGIVVWEALSLALMGLALGGLASLGAARVIQSQLFGVTASNPVTLIAGGALMVAVTLAASYGPTRRAMRVDPLVAIRAE